jgi:hypothetical protein
VLAKIFVLVTDKMTGSYLDPELPGTSLRKGGGCGARPALFWGKELVGTKQRWGDMRKGREEAIRDMMKEDQQPTE